MEVRQGEDRRLGSHPEKLLTLEEAARRLNLPADDVRALIQEGRLTGFRLGGKHLRLRSEAVEAIRRQLKAKDGMLGKGKRFAFLGNRDASASARRRAPSTLWERLSDFFYYNDFYLVAILILLTLVAIIFTL